MSAFKSATRALAPNLRSGSQLAVPRSAPSASQILRPATTLAAGSPRVPARTPTKYGGVYTVTLIPGDGVSIPSLDARRGTPATRVPICCESERLRGMMSFSLCSFGS